ncbi:MAG: response regulator transcription factor [Deltaproteobacteria bacterium]|nr:response regulator transcription factor [Deltaproteobacteria bacterium]MCW5801679.1 response regulator transcription factor [Deltaproteobacteria bacterium]
MTSPRILVVDDDATARMVTHAMLVPGRFAVKLVASGAEALDVLGGERVDLVICDVMMPELDGFAVCRAMRHHHDWRRVPVMLLTGSSEPGDVVRGMEAGADQFVTKPVPAAVLRARAQAMLGLRERYADASVDPGALRVRHREAAIAQAGLTARERAVLDLLLLGRTHDEIALVLGISERTSRFHQANLLEKLGADSRNDLLRLFA